MTANGPPETRSDDEQLLRGHEASEIIRISGKTVAEFARFIGKSVWFVRYSGKILDAQEFVRLQYRRALRAFVGEDDYDWALERIRTRTRKRKGESDGNRSNGTRAATNTRGRTGSEDRDDGE